MKSTIKNTILSLLFLASTVACQETKTSKKERPKAVKASYEAKENPALASLGKLKLSEYGFFNGKISDLNPIAEVYHYELNSALFTDYAFKKRFIYLPNGKSMTYDPEETFDFPKGAVIIKNFYYLTDFRKPEGEKEIIETRLLIKETSDWKALSYIWNKEQTDAFLEVAGAEKQVEWTHYDGTLKQVNYLVPNMNQCKSCHMSDKKIVPIGPKARHLNRSFVYEEKAVNQLEYFESKAILNGLVEKNDRPANVEWDDEAALLHDRAIAYLDINCGHCHNPKGPAKTSGLDLTVFAKTNMEKGILKAPIAAGKGSGNLNYDIVPGNPKHSILHYRMASTDPGIMMPEIGRSLAHKEGVELISEWIKNMKVESSK
ncbi:SO2930 family diheme c-type cytochrome [Sediminitomix flava]|uniref:Putative repeat protein (TIGR03806 family) n=1 Tax=Sediminitomix flava TaxID=379075 RepID=A0A315ZIH2_SEDFL|nr:SO2930 family diheme c-type cytochrome [Sediminitomix flava]PWJ44900.1 putative repeat protein (TIGR03806 family) [Sediminitomix flava]